MCGDRGRGCRSRGSRGRRECKDAVTQISAANRALEQAGFKLVAAGLTYCISHPDEAAAAGYPPDVVERMFLKLG